MTKSRFKIYFSKSPETVETSNVIIPSSCIVRCVELSKDKRSKIVGGMWKTLKTFDEGGETGKEKPESRT